MDHHYFATSAFDWAVAKTREDAIASVARHAGADIIKRQVKNNKGLYVWSAKVNLPLEASYDINNYAPTFITKDGKRTDERVPISNAVEARVQNMKGHLVIEDNN